jgi:hypothetical protein
MRGTATGGWGIALVFAWQHRVGRYTAGARLTGGFGTASPPWAHRVSAVFGEVAQAPHREIMPAAEVFGDDDTGPQALCARRVARVVGADKASRARPAQRYGPIIGCVGRPPFGVTHTGGDNVFDRRRRRCAGHGDGVPL